MSKKPTKKEIKQPQANAQGERVRAALRWTEAAAPPDVMPPEHVYGNDGLSTGYTFNVYSRRVDVGCSSSASHSVGRTDQTTSQRPLRLFSTKLGALLALRNAVERECAERLAAIDLQIEQEKQNDRSNP